MKTLDGMDGSSLSECLFHSLSVSVSVSFDFAGKMLSIDALTSQQPALKMR